jgi:hypothetical protein
MRKLKQHGDDEAKLKKSYICKEAKKLLQQGYTVDLIREMLNITESLPPVDEEVISDVQNSNRTYLRNTSSDEVPGLISAIVPRTDPEVRAFIEKISSK